MPGESSGATARKSPVPRALWAFALALLAAAVSGASVPAPMTQDELDRFDGAKRFAGADSRLYR
jgi:hypothetical protein